MKSKKVQPPKSNRVYGNRIREILKELNMSQMEFADLAFNGDKSYTSLIINGKRKYLSLSIAFQISEVLERPIEDIFIFTPNPNKNKRVLL